MVEIKYLSKKDFKNANMEQGVDKKLKKCFDVFYGGFRTIPSHLWINGDKLEKLKKQADVEY